MEQVFQDIAFDASEMAARKETKVEITEAFVRERLERLLQDEDLGRFVL